MTAFFRTLLNRDVTYSVSNQLLVSGLNFAVGILAARALGVADFGLFSLILLMASFTSNIEEHVLTLPMMTLAGARAKRSASYFSAIFVLSLGFASVSALVIVGFVAGLLALRGATAGADLLLAAGLITFSQNLQITARRVLFARGKFRQAVGLDFLRLTIIAVLIAYLLAEGTSADVATALNILGVSALISAIPFLIAGLRKPVPRRLPLTVLRRHWPISSWLLLMLLVAIGQEQALWVFASVQFGDDAIGGLRAGQYLLGTTHLLIYALENFMPRTAAQKMRKDDIAGLIGYLMRQTRFVGLVSLALIIPLAIFAGPLLSLCFGPDFAAYADHTRIFAAVYAITIVRMIWVYYLRVVERTRDIFFAYVASSAVSLSIIFPMTAWLGVYGVPLTMLVAQAVLLAGLGSLIARHAARHGRIPAPAGVGGYGLALKE